MLILVRFILLNSGLQEVKESLRVFLGVGNFMKLHWHGLRHISKQMRFI
jgi:hypothetical protein